MKYLGFLFGLLFLMGGGAAFFGSKSAVQETVGALLLLSGVVCIAVAAVIDTIDAAEKRQATSDKQAIEERLAILKQLTEQASNQSLTAELLGQQNITLGQISDRIDYGNTLLKWIGEQLQPATPSEATTEQA